MAIDVRQRTLHGDQRIAFHASWADFQSLARSIGDQPLRIAFDGERVELMSPSPEHEALTNALDIILRSLAATLGVRFKGMRSTRWERPDTLRGVEADSSYYLTGEKIDAARRRPQDPADWPLPDLALEIDLRASALDRQGIYAALGVPEVWRFDGETVSIDCLGPDGEYQDAHESGWLGIRPEEMVHLLSLDAEDDQDFASQVADWARRVLVPRREYRTGG